MACAKSVEAALNLQSQQGIIQSEHTDESTTLTLTEDDAEKPCDDPSENVTRVRFLIIFFNSVSVTIKNGE